MEFSLPGVVSSTEVVGTLQLHEDVAYGFFCAFKGVTFAFLWVDDHLVCQIGAYMSPNVTLAPYHPTLRFGTDNPFLAQEKTALPVRMQVFRMSAPSPAEEYAVMVWTAIDWPER